MEEDPEGPWKTHWCIIILHDIIIRLFKSYNTYYRYFDYFCCFLSFSFTILYYYYHYFFFFFLILWSYDWSLFVLVTLWSIPVLFKITFVFFRSKKEEDRVVIQPAVPLGEIFKKVQQKLSLRRLRHFAPIVTWLPNYDVKNCWFVNESWSSIINGFMKRGGIHS